MTKLTKLDEVLAEKNGDMQQSLEYNWCVDRDITWDIWHEQKWAFMRHVEQLEHALAEKDRELIFLQDVFERHRGREKYMAEIVFQHIKHGDEKHQEWLRGALVEALCREDTEACMTFDDLRSQLADQARELERLRGEHTIMETKLKKLCCDHGELFMKYNDLLRTAVRFACIVKAAFHDPDHRPTSSEEDETHQFLATPAATALQQAKEEK